MKMRRSVRSFKPSHLHPNPGNILGRLNFWRLVPSNSRSTLSVQMPHPSAGTHDQRCFVKTTISDRDFLVHLFFCAICSRERLRNSFPLNTTISKYMYSARKMTVPVQIPHPTQEKFKFSALQAQTMVKCPVGCLGGGCCSFEWISA